MAEYQPISFNKKAQDKLKNPDDLEKYVQITNPSVWMVLAAFAVLLAGLLAWGFFGAVTTSVSGTGVCIDGRVICFLSVDDAAKVKVGNSASVDGHSMEVKEISRIPESREEAAEVLQSDYLVSSLMKEDWAYLVELEGDSSKLDEGVPLRVDITVERSAPISLVLKNW